MTTPAASTSTSSTTTTTSTKVAATLLTATSTEDFDKIINGNAGKLVVVDFSAEWCAPCKFVSPVFDELVEKYAGKVVGVHADADALEDIAERYSVRSLPAFFFFREGKTVTSMSGAKPDQLAEQFKANLPS